MKKLLFILTLFFINCSIAQTIGSKVSLLGTDGKTYTGVITDVQTNKYKVKYDGYNFDAWLTANQFTVTQQNASTTGSFKVGDKVEVLDRIGMWLPAEILNIKDGQYYIHFSEYNSDYYDTWVGNDKIRAKGINKSNNSKADNTKKQPEMNGALPKIVGTAWSLLCIYNKGGVPKNNHIFYPYLFGNNGRYEIQFPGMTTMGKYTVKGNQLTQVADGSDRLSETYTLKWNAPGNYLELIGASTVTRLQYHTKTAF